MFDLINWISSPEFKQQAFDFLTATTGVFVALRFVLVPALGKITDATANKTDDKVLLAISDVLDACTKWLDVATRLIPRVSVGPTPARAPLSTKASRRPPPPMRFIEPVDLSAMAIYDGSPTVPLSAPQAPPDPPEATPAPLDSSQDDTRRTRLIKPPPQA